VRGRGLQADAQTAHRGDSAGKFQETSSTDVHRLISPFCIKSQVFLSVL